MLVTQLKHSVSKQHFFTVLCRDVTSYITFYMDTNILKNTLPPSSWPVIHSATCN